MRKAKSHLWRGRLSSSMHPRATAFLSSFDEDQALAGIDCDVVSAHAIALAGAGVFGRNELKRVLRAIGAARRRLARDLDGARGEFHDIHPVVEKAIVEAAGEEIGGRVHLGKSRNDQVVADIIIYTRRRLLEALDGLSGLIGVLLDQSRRQRAALLPAYTHTRPAQPTTAGHFWLSYASALFRDAGRLLGARARLNFSPLGGCAAVGTAVRLNRTLTARLLGFAGVRENALDATGARDCVLEILAALAILQNTLSRLAADVILMSSDEAGLFDYPDRFADTSSAMPHKKNPDPLELVRARAGSLAGNAAGALAVTHGLPAGYSRDLQELKPALWRGLAQVKDSLEVVALTLPGLKPRSGRARELIGRSHACALDLAEVLCLKMGVPFRRAHFATGRLVKALAAQGRTLPGTSPAEASALLSRFAGRQVQFSGALWRDAVDPARAAARRRGGGPGSTGPLLAGAARKQRRLKRDLGKLARTENAAQRALRSAIARI